MKINSTVLAATCVAITVSVAVAGPSTPSRRRNAPTTTITTTPADYSQALDALAKGDQLQAELIMRHEFVTEFRSGVLDEDVAFLMGTLVYSRGNSANADIVLKSLAENASDTWQGQAAIAVRALDDSQEPSEHALADLEKLQSANDKQPVLLWMLAMQEQAQKHPDAAAKLYDQLAQQWNPGPATLLAARADSLDDQQKHDDALALRQQAVKAEVSVQMLDGLGRTLSHLKRWPEADEAFTKATTLRPRNTAAWQDWIASKKARGDAAGAEDLVKKQTAAMHATTSRPTRATSRPASAPAE